MIEINAVQFGYGKAPVLKGIGLRLEEGSFTAIVGPNGSGKTTLLKHLNGLLLPDKGMVRIDGIDSRHGSRKIMRLVGFVFQNPEDQLVNSIVEEDIAFGLENLGLPTEEIQRRVSEVLGKLGIAMLAKENVNCLSFGQKQLVALAGVLAMQPKYIVFDEPTAMLDPRNKSTILGMMKQLNDEGKAIVVATNNLADVRRHVKTIIVLNGGKVVFKGKSERLNRSVLREAGLDGG